MHLTTRTSLAMRALMACASNPGRIVRRHDIAQSCDASENHLAQVIHMLGQKGFLQTLRGRSGGMTLGRPASEITVGEVFRTFEAVLPFADCAPGAKNVCPLVGACRLKCVMQSALDAFYATLDKVTLDDLVRDNDKLTSLLAVA